MREPSSVSPLLLGCIVASILLFFIIDLVTPVGVVVPLFYTIPLLLSILAPQRRVFMAVAAAAIVLTALGYFFGPPGGVPWIVVTNRIIAVMVIGLTAVFYRFHRHVEDRFWQLEGLLPACPICKKAREDRAFWKQLQLYLAEHQDAQFTAGDCPQCRAAQRESLAA